MKKILFLFLLVALSAFRTSAQTTVNGDQSYVPGAWVGTQIPNASVTGTTQFSLAKLTGTGTAIISGTSDTSGMIGIVGSGAGTTGNATIAQSGQVLCNFDSAGTTANDYVINSTVTAGDCADGGSTPPGVQSFGRVLSTNGGAGQYVVALSVSGVSSGGVSLSTDNTWLKNNRFKGPDPFVDITAYGVIGFRPGVITPTDGSTTVTCTSGSPNVSIGNTLFANTVGATLQGCGATNTMSTPSAPTVTPIYAKGGTRTHNTVNSPTGSSTYQYLFVAADQGGGLTLPSPATTITTGLASLGLQTIGISATSRSNDTVTVTTASPVSLVAGQAVEILGVPGNSFDGWFLINAVSDSTHFTLTSTETDSRNQTAFITDQTSAGSGGTLAWYAGNKVALAAATTGAIRYYVCGERPGDGAFHVIGQTMLSDAATTYTDLQFEDWGSTYMANQAYPFYISDAICTAASATNDQLTTTIVSGGGTTNLVLAANAGNNSVAGAKIVFDAVPNILAAANGAAKTNGVIYIPPVCNSSCVESFPINSYLKLPAGVSIFQAGSLVLGETIESSGALIWDGSWANYGAAQFGTGGGAKISAISGNPALHLTGAGNNLKWISMTSSVNGSTFIVADNATTDIANTQLVTDGLASTDTLGMDIVYRDTTNTINDHSMDHSLISGGPDQVNDKSWTPLMWLAPCIANGCNTGYEVQLHYINFSERGVEIDGKGNCPILTTDWTYNQGNITPQFLVGPGCSFNGYAKFIHARLDTTGEPYLANLTLGGNFVFDFTSGGSTPNQPLISGFRPTSTAVSSAFTDGNAPLSDVNRGLDKQFPFAYLTAYPFDTTGSFLPTLQPFHLRSEPDAVVGGYSKYWILPPPTSITEAVSAGGSVPTGTWVYSVSATGIDGGETIMQPTPSSVATTTGGNQTVTVGWTPSVGAVTYNVSRCNTGSSTCTTGGVIGQSSGWVRLAQHQTGVSYVDTAASGSSVQTASVTSTGVSGMNDKTVWAPLFACPETSAPAGVATWDLFYCDATDHRLKLINNNGTGSDIATLADFAAPPVIGTTPAAGTFTVLGATSYLKMTETTAPSGASGFDQLYGDSTAHHLKMINNNGSAQSLVGFGDPIDLQANPLQTEIANAASTGTTVNLLAKLTGAPSTAVVATTLDTAGIIGCVVSGAGTTGSAVIAVAGTTVCTFDGATTAGDYVIASTSAGGQVHDDGSTEPTGVQVLGRVLSTHGGGGVYAMIVFPPDIESQAGGGGGGTVTSIGVTNADSNLTITGSPVTTSGTIGVNFPSYNNHFFLGNHSGGSAAPAPIQPTLADIAAGVAPSGTFNFKGTTIIEMRVSAGLTTSTNGDIGYDSTNNNWHVWDNSADSLVGVFASAPTTNHCIKGVVVSSNVTLADAGVCGTTSSVALAGPTGFTISGSPVTTSGTLTFAMPSGWILGDILGGNGSNSVARIVGNTFNTPAILTSTGSGGIAQAAVFTPTVGGGTSPPMVTLTSPNAGDTICESASVILVNCPNGVVINTQSGTSYTVLSTDRGATLSLTSASAKAITLPQAGSAGFTSNFIFGFVVSGGGAATITPTTSTITARGSSGLTSLIILSGQSGVCYSDNTNYVCSVAGFGYGTTGTITGTALTATCDSGTVTVNGAVAGEPVAVSSTTGADVGGAFYVRGSVTSSNTVTVYVCGTGTPSSLAYNVRVLP